MAGFLHQSSVLRRGSKVVFKNDAPVGKVTIQKGNTTVVFYIGRKNGVVKPFKTEEEAKAFAGVV